MGEETAPRKSLLKEAKSKPDKTIIPTSIDTTLSHCKVTAPLSEEGFKFIVITNQAGVARGMINSLELEKIHKNMISELQKDDIDILNIYTCPHHWDDDCKCRKPKPGMFFQASRECALRLDQTLFIGDDIRDCQAAYNAGCGSIFVGNSDELKILSQKEQPIFSTIKLNECVSNIIKHFNYNN